MMTDAVAIMFICTAMNHMGLIEAIEDELGYELPIIGCVKCSTFWATFTYLLFSQKALLFPIATAFLLSYLSVWLELLMGFIDSIYLKCYEKITDYHRYDKAPADTGQDDTADALSDLRQD